MKNYLKKHFARKNNTLVKNSFMVSITCIIKKTGKKFHNTAFVCFFSPRKYESILRGFCNMEPFREIATSLCSSQ